jgi:hypothetical protein
VAAAVRRPGHGDDAGGAVSGLPASPQPMPRLSSRSNGSVLSLVPALRRGARHLSRQRSHIAIASSLPKSHHRGIRRRASSSGCRASPRWKGDPRDPVTLNPNELAGMQGVVSFCGIVWSRHCESAVVLATLHRRCWKAFAGIRIAAGSTCAVKLRRARRGGWLRRGDQPSPCPG